MGPTMEIAAEDRAAIRGLLDRMGDAWARGDGEAYGELFSEDASYVTATGRRVVGRRAIAAFHDGTFRSVFKSTRIGAGNEMRLEAVTPDVVLVHGSGAVLFAGEKDRSVPPNGLLTIVAARRGGSWQLVSFSNTPTGRARNLRFLLRFLASRPATFRAKAAEARHHMEEEKRRNIAAWRQESPPRP